MKTIDIAGILNNLLVKKDINKELCGSRFD